MSYGADNQLAVPKLNQSNAMTMSSKKPEIWLVTLDTNSPHIYLGQVGLQMDELVTEANWWVSVNTTLALSAHRRPIFVDCCRAAHSPTDARKVSKRHAPV